MHLRDQNGRNLNKINFKLQNHFNQLSRDITIENPLAMILKFISDFFIIFPRIKKNLTSCYYNQLQRRATYKYLGKKMKDVQYNTNSKLNKKSGD